MKLISYLVWGLLIFGLFHSLTRTIYDPDLWWHLATAREMIDNQSFLTSDVFSHTLEGTPWINFEWLSQVIFYGVVHVSGFWGLFWFKAALMAFILVLFYFLIRRLGAEGPWGVVLMWGALKIIEPRLLTRPELFTFIFLLMYLILIIQLRTASRIQLKWAPWVFMLLMILWCNIHGGFIYGMGILGLFFIGAWWAQEDKKYQRVLFISGVFSFLGAFVNPYGPKIFKLLVDVLTQFDSNREMIQEWIPTTMHDAPFFWVFFFLSNILLIAYILKRNSDAKFWAPAVVVFSIWGSLSFRNTALLAFAGIPFLAGVSKNIKLSKNFNWAVWLLCLIPAVSLAHTKNDIIPSTPIRQYQYPEQACNFLRQHDIQGRMFNTYKFGGYVEWVFGKSRKVFFDGRYIFQPFLFEINDFKHILAEKGLDHSPWKAFFERYGVDYGLVSDPEGKIYFPQAFLPFSLSHISAIFPREQWALVYWDDVAMVFLKRVEKFEKIISEYEYKVLRPYNLEQMKVLIDENVISRADMERELKRHSQEVERSLLHQQLQNITF